ncbi:MAG TPA: DUF2071 domain-containing protein [Ktedonobacterales bacterium]|nr:DUF2071 domain-containing protein [Ktedonobacterales bacterium]
MDTQRVLATTSARPWLVPDRPWVMAQVWQKLLFAHWPVAPEIVRPHLPPAVPLDTFDGQAWVGVVPFLMDGVHFRGTPGFPTARHFAELNVRTYVTVDEKPGVYFFSLDAGSRLAVFGARTLFALPYYWARFAITTRADRISYRCERVDNAPASMPRAVFEARYWPTGPAQRADPGSLADWLTARYCLYTTRGSRLLRGEIHHAPWPLQPAAAEIIHNTMTAPVNIPLPATAPLLHYAERLEVLVWPLRQVR